MAARFLPTNRLSDILDLVQSLVNCSADEEVLEKASRYFRVFKKDNNHRTTTHNVEALHHKLPRPVSKAKDIFQDVSESGLSSISTLPGYGLVGSPHQASDDDSIDSYLDRKNQEVWDQFSRIPLRDWIRLTLSGEMSLSMKNLDKEVKTVKRSLSFHMWTPPSNISGIQLHPLLFGTTNLDFPFDVKCQQLLNAVHRDLCHLEGSVHASASPEYHLVCLKRCLYRLDVLQNRFEQLCTKRTGFFWERLNDSCWMLDRSKINDMATTLTSHHYAVLRKINEQAIIECDSSFKNSLREAQMLSERAKEAILVLPGNIDVYLELIQRLHKLNNYFGLVALVNGVLDASNVVEPGLQEAIRNKTKPYKQLVQTARGANYELLLPEEKPSLPHLTPFQELEGFDRPSTKVLREALAKIVHYPVEYLETMLLA